MLSEPAIQVRRKGKGKQIWALEKMENRLVDMRELYQEWKDFDEDNPVSVVDMCRYVICLNSSACFPLCHFASLIDWCLTEQTQNRHSENKEYADKTWANVLNLSLFQRNNLRCTP